MQHEYTMAAGDVLLRPLGGSDLEALRSWRNDSRLTAYLRKIPTITPEMQQAWFQRYLDDPNELNFIIEVQGTPIGTISLSHQGGGAECGKFLIGAANCCGRGYGRTALSLCLEIAFRQMELNVCTAHAHPLNPSSLVLYVNEGFRIVGSRPFGDGFEYAMELTRERYQILHQ